jgi:methyl-accepting chemotaxis protein
MDEVTQQNSALVEENAATAKTLEHQAKAMDEQVAFFQIASGDDSYAGRPAHEKPPSHAAAPKASGKPAAKKPTPAARMTEPARRSAVSGAGPARRMQTALATAVNADADWKEF